MMILLHVHGGSCMVDLSRKMASDLVAAKFLPWAFIGLFPQNSEETSQITMGWIPTNDIDTLDSFYEKGKFTPHGPEKHLLSTQGKEMGAPW